MNVQNLTIGEIAIGLAFILGLYGSIKQIKKVIKESVEKVVAESLKNTVDKVVEESLTSTLDDKFRATNDKLDEMHGLIRKLDVNSTKNFLVRYLSDIERGDVIFEAEKQCFWDEYDHYIDELKENSYIKEWVAKLKEEGKLKR